MEVENVKYIIVKKNIQLHKVQLDLDQIITYI